MQKVARRRYKVKTTIYLWSCIIPAYIGNARARGEDDEELEEHSYLFDTGMHVGGKLFGCVRCKQFELAQISFITPSWGPEIISCLKALPLKISCRTATTNRPARAHVAFGSTRGAVHSGTRKLFPPVHSRSPSRFNLTREAHRV